MAVNVNSWPIWMERGGAHGELLSIKIMLTILLLTWVFNFLGDFQRRRRFPSPPSIRAYAHGRFSQRLKSTITRPTKEGPTQLIFFLECKIWYVRVFIYLSGTSNANTLLGDVWVVFLGSRGVKKSKFFQQ